MSASPLHDFDDAAIAVDDDPVTGFDDVERIAIAVGDARHAHNHRAKRNLRRHLVEHQGSRRRSGQPRRVVHRRPARRSLRTAADEHLVLEALAAKLVLHLGDDTLYWIVVAPPGYGLSCEERLAFPQTARELES